MTTEMHVLLAEHDTISHSSIKKMLEYFSYKVTSTKLASTALSILCKGDVQYDIILANINSPDLCGFKLVQDAIKMDLPVFLITDDDDDTTTTNEALEVGAFLYIKKPVTIETIKYLDQHVWRKKIRAQKIEEIRQNRLHNEINEESSIDSKMVNNINNEAEEESKLKKKKKTRTRWTEELHEKFVEAIKQLGEGGCYPQDILELMNVPDLTRMQVASHLQRCREGTWRPPKERNPKVALRTNYPHRPKTRSGLMPKCQLRLPVQENHENIHYEAHNINISIQNDIVLGATELTGGSCNYGEGYHPLACEDPLGYSSYPFDLGAFQWNQPGILSCNVNGGIDPDVPFQFNA